MPEIEAPQKAKGVVHKMIADTAKGLAREQWEVLARQNAFYRRYPNVDVFERICWPQYVPMARQILTAMLGSPKYDTHFKDTIMDALLRDGAVNPKKMAEPEKPRFFLTDKT